MEQKIRILIADDHQLLTSGLKLEIAQWEDFEVAGITSNGKDTVEFWLPIVEKAIWGI